LHRRAEARGGVATLLRNVRVVSAGTTSALRVIHFLAVHFLLIAVIVIAVVIATLIAVFLPRIIL
jgi:hypothetical protein